MSKVQRRGSSLKSEMEAKLGHRIGHSRREFLASGLIPFSCWVSMPPLLALLMRSQVGQAQGSASAIPFLCFDMAGGAALPGNALVGKAGGPEDWLGSYSTLGWNPRTAAVDKRFGLPMGTSVSGLFRGMISAMSEGAQRNLRLGSVCHFSQLDTGDNPQNISVLVRALGCRGSFFSDGMKHMQTRSGGRSASVADDNGFSSVYVEALRSVLASFYHGGAVLADLGRDELRRLALATRQLTAMQIDMLQSERGGALLKERVDAYLNEDLTFPEVDPRENTTAQGIWQISRTSGSATQPVVEATITTNVIDGLAGPGTITLGGCDYHDGTSATGDRQDLAMGVTIGRAVQYAHVKGRPLFFQLITDGSCSAQSGTRNWNADTNEGMQIFGYYNPSQVPEYERSNMQIGHFNEAQSAERRTLVGSDPRLASLAVFANYCNVQGRLGEFQRFSRAFNQGELAQLVVLAEGGMR